MTIWTKESALEYLYQNSEITESGCREWQGSLNKHGYSQLSSDSLHAAFGIKGVHRLMVHLTTGHQFAGRHEQVLHSCDNRRCIHPAHIRVGTPAENGKEKAERSAYRGSNSKSSIINEEIAAEIKRRLKRGGTQNEIAASLGVTRNIVAGISLNRSWRHVHV